MLIPKTRALQNRFPGDRRPRAGHTDGRIDGQVRRRGTGIRTLRIRATCRQDVGWVALERTAIASEAVVGAGEGVAAGDAADAVVDGHFEVVWVDDRGVFASQAESRTRRFNLGEVATDALVGVGGGDAFETLAPGC